jgi:UDP-N-acetylmuramate dehydrogenase
MGLSRDSIEKRIQHSVLLASYTTFRIGGPATYFIQPVSMEQFGGALEWALGKKIPFFVLGGGANILVHDRGFDGLVIHTGKLTGIAVEKQSIHAECGLTVDRLVDTALDHGLSGLEFAAGLPGTVGGALFMNARAYEGEFSAIVSSVQALQIWGKRAHKTILKRDNLRFSYKQSVFQGKEYYVYSVHLLLASGDKNRIQLKSEQIRQKRQEAGQFVFPNAGCIFKNNYDVGIPTGRIIDELGLKGTRIGDAEVYRKHGNFIINRGSATAEDVHRLIRLLESRLEEHLGVRMEREINLIGPWEERG